MLPVIAYFQFLSPSAQLVAYVLALAVVLYSAWSGWVSATGPEQPRQNGVSEPAPATTTDRLSRAAMYAVLGAAVASVGLHYMLPGTAFLGGRGEGLPIHTYGIMLGGGFLLAVRVSAIVAEREWRLDGPERRNQVNDLAFWVLLGGIGGAKLLFMLVNWQQSAHQLSGVLSNPGVLVDLISGGLVFQGGLLGAMAVSYWYATQHGMNFFRLSDVAAPTVSLGSALGRLGCFSAGCCWGDVTPQGHRWGVHFPGGSVAQDLFGRHVEISSLVYQSQHNDPRWVMETTGQLFHQAVPGAVRISEWVATHGHTLPVYPTQILDSLGNLTLFLVAMSLRRFRRFHGQVLGIWLMGYSVLRTTVELFRGDVDRGTLHGLLDMVGGASLADHVPLEVWYNFSTGQFISLCMFGLGATLLIRRRRNGPPSPNSDRPAHPPAPVSA